MRIELEELGAGQFVELRDPNKLRWSDQKAITSTLKDDSVSSQLDVSEAISIYLCKSGNVLDEDNVPIVFPLTAETIGNVPATLIEKVAKAFVDAKKATTPKN